MRSLPRESGPVHAPNPPHPVDLTRERLADLLAWLNDCPTNELEDYPGPGWHRDGGPGR